MTTAKETNDEYIQDSIRSFLKERGATNNELTKLLHQEYGTVQKKTAKKTPQRKFTLEDAVTIADHYGVSVDSVIGRDTPQTPLSISDILEFLFKAARQYDTAVVQDTSGDLYEDISTEIPPSRSEPYTLYGFSILCKEWNDALNMWSAVSNCTMPTEQRKAVRKMVEKQLLSNYKNILPDDRSMSGRGIPYFPSTFEDEPQHIDTTDDTDTTY